MRAFICGWVTVGFCLTIAVSAGCSRDTGRRGVDVTTQVEGAAAMSDIKSDEEVVFFPTSAHLDANGKTWFVPIHGVIYEPEADSKKCALTVAAILRTVKVEAGTSEAENLDRRVRFFLVDNERGKNIVVRVGAKAYTIGDSEPNGHFLGIVRLPASEVDELLAIEAGHGDLLPYQAATRPGDDRLFVGQIQFVGPTGMSIISDIDDTIKHSQVGDHKAVLANTFLHKFQPVPGMPELYRHCADQGMAFHYVSGSPWQLYLPLAEFLRAEGIPAGSFNLKYFRLKDPSTLGLLRSQEATKLQAIEPILADFPQRRFILIGDSGEQDPEIYMKVAREHRDQIVAIFIRNVTGESIQDDRFRTLREQIDGVRFKLFDRPEQIRSSIDEVQSRYAPRL